MYILRNYQNSYSIFFIYIGYRKLSVRKETLLLFYSHCSYQEFLEQTKKPVFLQDEGWQGLDEQQVYSQQEYEAYERHKQEEIQKMIAKGMVSKFHRILPVHLKTSR